MIRPPRVLWRDPVPELSSKQPVYMVKELQEDGSTKRRARPLFNSDGTPAISNAELGEHLRDIADNDDDGESKTGRRYYYLALSHGYIRPDMSATKDGEKSRKRETKRITDILGTLRKNGSLPWNMVIDLTRELDLPLAYTSTREARAHTRGIYNEDRWLQQPYYPIFVVEKDTMEPVCKPMADKWHMPFASSRGYSSLSCNTTSPRWSQTVTPAPGSNPSSTSFQISIRQASIYSARGALL
jgi:hypothetical protein